MIDPKRLFRFGLIALGILDVVLAALLISPFLQG